MSRLLPGQLKGHERLPWSLAVEKELDKAGYKFTYGLVSDLGFIKTWECVKDNVAYWARAFDIGMAPQGYYQLFFPDGLKPDNFPNGDFICPIYDVLEMSDWIFTISQPAFITMTDHMTKFISRELQNQEQYVKYWIPQVIYGLIDLLGQGYFHGDLCFDNILISSDKKVMLTGFSLKQLQDVVPDGSLHLKNYRFHPPSMINPESADVWALGIIIYELLTGEELIKVEGELFDDLETRANRYFDFLNNMTELGDIKQQITHHPAISAEAATLILSCLELDESKRPKIGLLDGHEFFKMEDEARAEYEAANLSSEPNEEDSFEKVEPSVHQELVKQGVTIKYRVGGGGFGQVYRVKYDGQYRAMKAAKLVKEQHRVLFETEKTIMITVVHPNIIEIIHWFEIPSYGIFFIMELAISDLSKQINLLLPIVRSELVEDRMKVWLKDAATGLDYLHKCGYVHLDFKPLNTLIRANDIAVVTDFGLSIKVDDPYMLDDSRRQGTQRYMSPQVIRGEMYRPAMADVYAFGVTALQCLGGGHSILDSVKVKQFQERTSKDAQDLVFGCLQDNELTRYTFSEILSHRWFNNAPGRAPTSSSGDPVPGSSKIQHSYPSNVDVPPSFQSSVNSMSQSGLKRLARRRMSDSSEVEVGERESVPSSLSVSPRESSRSQSAASSNLSDSESSEIEGVRTLDDHIDGRIHNKGFTRRNTM